jgi:hypothetical protein
VMLSGAGVPPANPAAPNLKDSAQAFYYCKFLVFAYKEFK